MPAKTLTETFFASSGQERADLIDAILNHIEASRPSAIGGTAPRLEPHGACPHCGKRPEELTEISLSIGYADVEILPDTERVIVSDLDDGARDHHPILYVARCCGRVVEASPAFTFVYG
jgi:glutaredoxin